MAEPVTREFAPGMMVNLWGYNGQSPGPTIEAVEGDHVRVFVTNKLPEHTSVHWHGMLVPNGMDGVGGLTQPHIPVGKTFVYEFVLKKSGTFMYHPHSDEMVQMAMGMMGMVVVHPRDPALHRADRDFVFVMSSYDVTPGASLPNVTEMTDFNMWTWNSRVFPGIDVLPVSAQRPRAHQDGQSHHDQPSDPSAWARFPRDHDRWRLGARDGAIPGGDHRRSGRHRCARSNSSPTLQATGRSTATNRITP